MTVLSAHVCLWLLTVIVTVVANRVVPNLAAVVVVTFVFLAVVLAASLEEGLVAVKLPVTQLFGLWLEFPRPPPQWRTAW